MTADLYFEDVRIGESIETSPIAAREAAMVDFAREWDPMPIHVDPVAARESMFKGITASSVYTMGLKQLLVKQLLTERTVICMLGFDEGKLPAPLYGGREVRLIATWLEKRRSKSRDDAGVMRFRIRLVTNHNETVLDYVETVLLRCRQASAAGDDQ